jgi:amidohydrolase
MMAVRAYTDIEFMIAKEISAREPIIFNCGAIHGGVANNVICDHASMFCTLRTHSDETAKYVLDKIKRIGEAVAETAGGRFEYTHKKHYPTVYNDPEIEKKLRAVAAETVGGEFVVEKRRSMGGEDFSYLSNEKPGCMFRLGVKNAERGIVHGLHTDLFDIDESALDVGVSMFVNYVLKYMN